MRLTRVLLICLFAVWIIFPGCKKETPSSQKPSPPRTVTQSQLAKEKEFLSDPDVVVCKLKETTISELDLPERHLASFIHRMKREGRKEVAQIEITLVNRPFRIVLGDTPRREFYLYDVEKGFGPYWWGSWSIHSYHKLDGKFFEFMLVDEDRKIAARPYKGKLGSIKLGKGSREIDKMDFNGSVYRQGSVSAPIGVIKERWPDAVTECRIPEGDYTANILNVIYGNLQISISNNYHTNAQSQLGRKETVYGMQVREDKPYVLDFSNEPMVVFDKPHESRNSFSRGEEIEFAAVLIDPKLDIMIRGLDDTSVKVDKEYKDEQGKVVHTAKVNKSLDPNVVITRADGEIVAEGVMPFG